VSIDRVGLGRSRLDVITRRIGFGAERLSALTSTVV
jgi:hypothetical protein